jgi:diguanylate cyclase
MNVFASLVTVLVVALLVAGERVVATRRHRRSMAEVWRLAYADDLTGLANRRALLAHLDQALTVSRPVGLLLIDLDGFKVVNDTYGHRAGDHVLRVAGERLSAVLGPGCLVARLGGDEFAVMTRDGGRARLSACVHRVRAGLGEPVDLGHAVVRMTASVGTTAHVPGDSATDLLARADAAMYQTKKRRTRAAPDPRPVGVVDTHHR